MSSEISSKYLYTIFAIAALFLGYWVYIASEPAVVSVWPAENYSLSNLQLADGRYVMDTEFLPPTDVSGGVDLVPLDELKTYVTQTKSDVKVSVTKGFRVNYLLRNGDKFYWSIDDQSAWYKTESALTVDNGIMHFHYERDWVMVIVGWAASVAGGFVVTLVVSILIWTVEDLKERRESKQKLEKKESVA